MINHELFTIQEKNFFIKTNQYKITIKIHLRIMNSLIALDQELMGLHFQLDTKF